MKVVLIQDLKGKGKAGEIINANEGYARNFLIPNGIAQPADTGTVNAVKTKQAAQAHQKQVEKQDAQKLADRIGEMEVSVTGKGGSGGKLFGAITNKEVAQALKEQQGIDIDKKKISVPSSIKTAGEYTASVKVYAEIAATLKFQVTIIEE